MTTLTDPVPAMSHPGWFSRSEAWLDSKGKGAWIAAMVLGFVIFWPIGLAVLFYMIWSKRMFNKSCRHSGRHSRMSHSMSRMSGTGNSAFDTYKADTLARLEQEQNDFETFLARLRDAKDKAEFDQFMQDRAQKAGADTDEDEAA